MERPSSRREREPAPKEKYLGLLESYEGKTRDLKKLKARIPGGVADKEVLTSISIIDRERNEIHDQLKLLGEKLGKNETDVMTDILRLQGSLAAYELPEFFILDSADMGSPNFNTDLDAMRPERMKLDNDAWSPITIDPSNVVIPFMMKPQWIGPNWEGGYMAPKDFAMRERRAKALAKAAKLEIVEGTDYEYFHDSTVAIYGVVVPKSRIEEVARIIREHPGQFRIGEDFYSDEDRIEIERSYRQMIEDDLGYWMKMNDEEYIHEYWSERKALYGEDRPKKEPQPVNPTELLAKVNSFFEKILGMKSALKRLPDAIEGAEALKNKKILMVDDDIDVFEAFIPLLVTATGGTVDFLVHGGQDIKDTVNEVMKSGAEIVLLDKNLAMGVDGVAVAKSLMSEGFEGKIMGFSSDPRAHKLFKDAGALGSVMKNVGSPSTSLKSLAKSFG